MMTRNKEMPCLNCRLIEMGEMACYQVSTITISTSIVITIIIISIVNTIIIIITITSTNDQDRCPQCGRVPPSKKGLPPEKISQASFFGGYLEELTEQSLWIHQNTPRANFFLNLCFLLSN